jgi:hypothetical protein
MSDILTVPVEPNPHDWHIADPSAKPVMPLFIDHQSHLRWWRHRQGKNPVIYKRPSVAVSLPRPVSEPRSTNQLDEGQLANLRGLNSRLLFSL